MDITFVAWNRSLLGEQSTCSGTRIRASNLVLAFRLYLSNDADRYPKDSPASVKGGQPVFHHSIALKLGANVK